MSQGRTSKYVGDQRRTFPLTSAAKSYYLGLGCSSEVQAAGRIDDVYDDHGSSDARVFGERVRGNDADPIIAIERSRTCQMKLRA